MLEYEAEKLLPSYQTISNFAGMRGTTGNPSGAVTLNNLPSNLRMANSLYLQKRYIEKHYILAIGLPHVKYKKTIIYNMAGSLTVPYHAGKCSL